MIVIIIAIIVICVLLLGGIYWFMTKDDYDIPPTPPASTAPIVVETAPNGALVEVPKPITLPPNVLHTSGKNQLKPGEFVENGKNKLVLQSDGNLVFYTVLGATWATYTSNTKLVSLQADGNLVCYDEKNAAVWQSKTSDGANKSARMLQIGPTSDDFSLSELVSGTEYKVYWNSKTSKTGVPVTNAVSNKFTELKSGQELKIGQSVVSLTDDKVALTLQEDGNLVLKDGAAVLWSSGTSGTKPIRLAMQPDGNLVLYAADNLALWNSRTSIPNLTMRVEGKRFVVGTFASDQVKVATQTIISDKKQLDSGESIEANIKIVCAQGTGNFLVLQTDGNLVLYPKAGGTAIWNAGTYGRGATKLNMQKDGNLTLTNKDNNPVWATMTSSKDNWTMRVETNRFLVGNWNSSTSRGRII